MSSMAASPGVRSSLDTLASARAPLQGSPSPTLPNSIPAPWLRAAKKRRYAVSQPTSRRRILLNRAAAHASPGALVGITGDSVVHAVWGGSDGDPTSPDAGGIWTSTSSDYGTTWSVPQRLLTHCWNPLDIATTPSGQIVVLSSCWTLTRGDAQPHTEFAIRDKDVDEDDAAPVG